MFNSLYVQEKQWIVMYFLFISVIFSLSECVEYIPIKWNISTDVGHSKNERLYEYPMFTEIAPSPCDITVGVCDIGCCVDPDCDTEQKIVFNCSTGTAACARPFSKYDCNCPNPDRPFWFSALCYVFENPIYLGLFYKTLSKIEDLKLFDSRKSARDYKYEKTEKLSNGKQYKFGSTVLSYLSQNGSFTPARHALLHGGNILPGHSCELPVKYMLDSRHSCYVRLTKENCDKGSVLGAKSYLLRNENSTITHDIPVILKNLETDELAKIDISINYSSSRSIVKRIRGKLYKYIFINDDLYDIDETVDLFNTFWNGTHCCNIIARAVFHFITNATDILNVYANFVLANVSASREKSENEFVYLKKYHDVRFMDISTGRGGDIRDDYELNRGYYEGENLNFGYNRTNGTHIYWERGHLNLLLNGEFHMNVRSSKMKPGG